jgi:PKD repeat protein
LKGKKKIIIVFEFTLLIIFSTFVASMLGNNPENQIPIAHISANVTIGKTPLNINFKGFGSDNDGIIVSYLWDFGDGETSDLQNPTHIYEKKGKYVVTLIITDNNGNIGRKNIIIYAQENITPKVTPSNQQGSSNYIYVDFTWSPEYPDPGQKITFISNYYDYSGVFAFASKFWNFGDGESGWGSVVSHIYDKKGRYKVTLIITATDYSSGEITNGRSIKYINIGASPFPKFTYSPKMPSTGEKIFFDASESWDNNGEIEKYHWSYIDSREPNKVIDMGYNKTITHIWKKQGYYNVKLTVTDDENNTNEITKDIVVSVLKIQEISAGFRQVGFKITNRGNITVNNIHWQLKVNRNFLIIPLWRIFQKSGIIYTLRPGESIPVNIGRYRRGFGLITLTITIETDNAVKITESQQGYMLGKFVHLSS